MIGDLRERCFAGIDFNHHRPGVLCDMRQIGGRINDAGGANNKKHVRLPGCFLGQSEKRLVERLSEPDNIRPQWRTTGRTLMRSAVFPDGKIATAPMATHTPSRSVNFKHPSTSRFLVETVYVLRDHAYSGGQKQLLEFGDTRVARVRMGAGKQLPHFIVPGPDPLRVTIKAFDTGNRHRIDIGPQTVGSVSEGGNTALGGQTCAGEKNNLPGRAKLLKN